MSDMHVFGSSLTQSHIHTGRCGSSDTYTIGTNITIMTITISRSIVAGVHVLQSSLQASDRIYKVEAAAGKLNMRVAKG